MQHHGRRRTSFINHTRATGQGVVEYAIILLLVAASIFAVIRLLGPAIADAFADFVGDAPVAPPELVGYTPPPTWTPTGSPTATTAPTSTASPVPSNTPGGPPPTFTATITPTATNTNTPVATACAFNVVHPLPGRIEVEDYRCGGSGVAYVDADSTNNGGEYRPGDGVDIEAVSGDATGGNYNIGWTQAGEWLRYDVSIAANALYDIGVRVATPFANGRYRIRIDGIDVTGLIAVPNTGGFQSWLTLVVTNVPLAAGNRVLELAIEGDAANYNYITIAGTPTPTPTPSNTPSPTATPSNTPTPSHTPTATTPPPTTPPPSPTSPPPSPTTPAPPPSPTTPAPPQSILFVGNTPLNAADIAARNRLTAMGYTVIVRDDGAATTADATGKRLVVISSTSSSGLITTKYRNVAVPVLLWETALLDDMSMSSSTGSETNETEINIVGAGHPMAAGNSNGTLQVTNSTRTFSWAVAYGTATIIAHIDNDNDHDTIFGYNTGVNMSGLTAPARRVFLFLQDDTATALNAAGWNLFNAAVTWAIGP
jgi:hypothetical protein